jgi:hypothetical protein
MPKWSIHYDAYKKVLLNDLEVLKELLMEADAYDEMVDVYLDQSQVRDEQVEPFIKEDMQKAMDKGKIVDYMALNAFLGSLKKLRTKNLRKKRL